MLGSKLGLIWAGRTTETFENTAEPSMLILTYGTDINRETTLMTQADNSLPMKPNMEDFWRIFGGWSPSGVQESPTESDDTKALNRFNENLSYKNGRYIVTWQWKKEKPDLPQNHGLALGRLKSLINRMKRNPDLVGKYTEIKEEQLKQGIIEMVSPDVQSNNTIKHHIPHHEVIKQPQRLELYMMLQQKQGLNTIA